MHVTTMFVKPKQQRIREQLDIKPDQKSKSHSEAISRGKKSSMSNRNQMINKQRSHKLFQRYIQFSSNLNSYLTS